MIPKKPILGHHTDWFVAGCMRKARLIPERRTFAMEPFAKTEPGKLSQRGFGALAGVETSVVGLGIARCAIDTFKALAKKQTPYTGTMVLASLHPVQEKVGTAEALLRSGRAFLSVGPWSTTGDG